MARAGLVVVVDQEFDLPFDGSRDRHFQAIDCPGIDLSRPAVLAFRIKPLGEADVQFRIRQSKVRATFPSNDARDPEDDERERSWLEVIGVGNLMEENNELIVSIQPGGRARVSDIVLFYQLKSALFPRLGGAFSRRKRVVKEA
jgi:hypothetical protein